jgi:hypothetical protein
MVHYSLLHRIRISECSPHTRTIISLPGWCLLSRKHAQGILDIPSQLGGMNLWPAFERVWAPEEVFLPTALAISGNLNSLSGRALTHSRWDERAADHKDRAHPLSYDGSFDDELVSMTRAEGCLFLRKMKRSLDLSVWDRIVIRRGRCRDADTTGRPQRPDATSGWDRRGDERGSDQYWYGNRSRMSRDFNGQRRKREPGDLSDRNDNYKRQHWRR